MPVRRLSLPWLLATVLMVALIWGNSLVPGEGSSGISLMVVDAVRSFLDSLGLSSAWVTNFLVRKTAHFTEYMVLGMLATRAIDHDYRAERGSLIAVCLTLVLVPSIDETIQLFVAGRAGQVTDVLLDCCGAATGVLISYFAFRRLARWAASRRRDDGGGTGVRGAD